MLHGSRLEVECLNLLAVIFFETALFSFVRTFYLRASSISFGAYCGSLSRSSTTARLLAAINTGPVSRSVGMQGKTNIILRGRSQETEERVRKRLNGAAQ